MSGCKFTAVASLFGTTGGYVRDAIVLARELRLQASNIGPWQLRIFLDESVPADKRRALEHEGCILHDYSSTGVKGMRRMMLRFLGLYEHAGIDDVVASIDVDKKDHGKMLRALATAHTTFMSTGFSGIQFRQPFWAHGTFSPDCDGCVTFIRVTKEQLDAISFLPTLHLALRDSKAVVPGANDSKLQDGYGVDEIYISRIFAALVSKGMRAEMMPRADGRMRRSSATAALKRIQMCYVRSNDEME